MLRVTGRATVAAGQNLAFIQQAIDHQLAGLFDAWPQHVHGAGFGFNAVSKQLPDSVLHIHRDRDSLAGECFSDPLIRGGIRWVALRGDNIESARLIGQMGVGKQVMLGCGDNAFLLAPIDRFRSVAPSGTSSVTYFDKYYCICIAHDQIKLALLAAIVSCQQAHASPQ